MSTDKLTWSNLNKHAYHTHSCTCILYIYIYELGGRTETATGSTRCLSLHSSEYIILLYIVIWYGKHASVISMNIIIVVVIIVIRFFFRVLFMFYRKNHKVAKQASTEALPTLEYTTIKDNNKKTKEQSCINFVQQYIYLKFNIEVADVATVAWITVDRHIWTYSYTWNNKWSMWFTSGVRRTVNKICYLIWKKVDTQMWDSMREREREILVGFSLNIILISYIRMLYHCHVCR